ncbi:unnamed protein product [Calypogeia fissa]
MFYFGNDGVLKRCTCGGVRSFSHILKTLFKNDISLAVDFGVACTLFCSIGGLVEFVQAVLQRGRDPVQRW